MNHHKDDYDYAAFNAAQKELFDFMDSHHYGVFTVSDNNMLIHLRERYLRLLGEHPAMTKDYIASWS